MTRGDPHLVGLRKAKRGERWKERIELVTNAKEGISSDVEAIEAIEAPGLTMKSERKQDQAQSKEKP